MRSSVNEFFVVYVLRTLQNKVISRSVVQYNTEARATDPRHCIHQVKNHVTIIQ